MIPARLKPRAPKARAPAAGARGFSRAGAALLLFVVFVSAAAVFIARRATPASPVSDIALVELYTREAMHGRLLVGPYSRFGWHHPGPLLFYALAPVYAIGGRNTAALHAAAAVLSLAIVAAAVFVTTRRSGRGVGSAAMLAILLLAGRLPAVLISPWNPHIVMLPSIAFLAVAAVGAAGSPVVLPLVVALASFLAQADVALVPFAAAVGVAALACRPAARDLVISIAVAILLWLPAIVDELARAPGNATLLWRFFARGGTERLGFARGVGVWADAVTAPFRSFELARGAIVEPTAVASHVVLAFGLTAGAALAAALASRAGVRVLAWFAALSAAASLVGLWSVSRIEGVVSDHQAFWMAALGAADAAACAVAVVRIAIAPTLGIAPLAAGLAVVAGLALQGVGRAAAGTFPVTVDAPSAPNFATSIGEYLTAHQVRRPLFRIDQEQWWLAAAILLELDRRGVSYAVEDAWMPMFPDRFRADRREDAELWLAATNRHRELAARHGDVTVDASSFIHVEAVRISSRDAAPPRP